MTPRLRLFPKYALLIATLVGGMLAVNSAIGIWFSYRETESHLVALQVEKAGNAATRIEQYVLDIEHQMSWTALPRGTTSADGLDAGLDPRRTEFLKLLRQAPAITEVVWIDPTGHEQLRVSRLAMDSMNSGVDRSKEAKFTAASGGSNYYSPVYFRKDTEPYMTISRPAGPGGGVTAAEVNLKFVWDVVSRIRIGKAGIAYVVDANGTLIAHPDISLVLKKSSFASLPQVAALSDPDRDASPLGREPDGDEVFTAHSSIPTLGWTVFVETPRAEALAPLYASIARAALLLAAGLLVSAVASYFLARTLVRPLKTLQEGAARFGAGELDRQITVRTGDELEGLAEQFNRMGADLAASYAGLERKVDERTAALTEALEQQVATSEVLKVISGSVADSAPVFEKILDSCERLFAATGLGIFLIDEREVLHASAWRGHAGLGADLLADSFPRPLAGTATAIAARTRAVFDCPSVLGGSGVPERLRRIAEVGGDFSIAFAPMLWEGRAVGSIEVSRQPPSPFTEKELGLLKTFADQAVIAIQNSRLFNEIAAKSRELELANQHKSEFLANMSHELRTPLNAIIGFSEVLAEKIFGDVNDKQREYLLDIHSSGHHLLSLINDILDLSKIEAGRMELDLAEVDVPMLLDHCATLVRERATRQGLKLALDIDPSLGAWVADVRKLKQIVINLLSNAVKFTPAGGRVTLRALSVDDRLEIAVIDTGVGIAPDQQALVFEEFRQADGNYLRKSEGTGLGLSLARKFVELHGGGIRVDSVPGRGSTFAFTLPERVLEAL